MKLRVEDILKSGSVLTVEKVDFNDPEIARFVAITKRRQKQILRNKNRPFKNLIITI